MNQEGYILNQLKKAKLPEVNAAFFDELSNDVLELVKLEEATSGLLDKITVNKFENDFKSNNNIDLEGVNKKTVKFDLRPKTDKKIRRITLWAGAIAASLVLFFSLPYMQSNSVDLADDLSTEEVLLAYLAEDDLIDFMVDENTSLTDTEVLSEDELFYEELEDELYNYLNEMQ